MTRAKELGIGQLGATADASSRAAAAAEVQQLFAQALQVGNQRFGDEYLFGGNTAQGHVPFDPAQTGSPPRFVSLVAGVPVAPQGVRVVEAGAGQIVAGPHDGTTVFVDTKMLEVLHDLGTALAANDGAGLTTAMRALDASFTDVQTLVGEIGARQNQVDTIRTQLDALEQNLDVYRSGLSEVDMEQAITEMVGRQTAYQAAMLASSKVLGLSLTDYLR
jgi:flagellar hook-associated protein 3 FlgL